MKVSLGIKRQVSKVLNDEFPYNRPAAEEVMEKLSFNINEQDPAAVLDYIEQDLETRGFESDLDDFIEVIYIAD